ncbi:MAG: hypothetical protein WC119_11760, partial [Synergistaceae bacterium]
EEQRGALARAIDYINETDLPVGELDGFDREVLRNMVTTAINYDPDVMKMIELLAAGEHEQWADWAQSILDSEPGLSDGRKAAWPEMIATPYENLSEELKDKDRREVHLRSSVALDYIQQQSAEIERLRAENEEALESLTAAYLLGRHEKAQEVAARPKEGKIDSSEHVTEPTKMIGFDLEKARAADEALPYPLDANEIWVSGKGQMHINPPNAPSIFFTLSDLCEFRNLFHGQAAEIERQRPFEIAARDLDSDLGKIAGERDEQAARIKELEAELAEMHNCALEVAGFLAEKENLEAALVEERANKMIQADDCTQNQDAADFHHRCICEYNVKKCPIEQWWLDRARITLQAEGKIGPDAKPRSWQITDERKATLSASLKVLERLKKNNTDTDHSYLDRGITVLRDMLTEAGL